MVKKENGRFLRSRSVYHRGGVESLSEPDLTTADKKSWNSGFPPGFTVDELRYHRRKRAPGKPRDHLGLEDGTFSQLKTEYKRRYKDYYSLGSSAFNSKDVSPLRAEKPDDVLKLEGPPDIQPGYNESFIEYPIEQVATRRRKRSAFQLIDDVDMALYDETLSASFLHPTSEGQSQFVKYEDIERRAIIHQPDHLKLEGELFTATESADQFIEYLLTQRRGLLRTSTHLKMEGDMENKTEMREQFVPLNYQARPPLCKKLTNLHLEGDMDVTTENTEKFITHDYEKRRPLIKRSTNLQLEGDFEHKPEYRQQYVEFASGTKALPTIPQNNLYIDGFFDGATENKTKFVDHDPHPVIPFLRGSDFNKKLLLGDDAPVKFPEYREQYVQHSASKSISAKKISNLKPEGDFETVTENQREYIQRPMAKVEKQTMQPSLQLEGQIDMNPEYRNAYVDFYKSGSVTSPGRRRRTYSQSSNLKNDGPMESYPEYKRSYVDFPRQRPTLKRPEGNLSSEGDLEHTTEKRAQFVEYPNYQRTDSLKRESELKMDGDFVCQPEYRKAYVDYLIRERMERKPRPIDNLAIQPKRAFEVIPSSKIPTSESSTLPKTSTTPSSSSIATQKSLIPVSVKKVPLPPTTKSSTPSTLPRPKSRITTIQTTRRKSISRLETQLFGPKIEVHIRQRARSSSKPPSRGPSPLPPKSRSRSIGRSSRLSSYEDDTHHSDRIGARFSSTIKVEDLAYTPSTSPIPTNKIYDYSSSRKRWNKAEQSNDSAFLVLDDNNNNGCKFDGYTTALKNSLRREQKWMPSWYSP